MKKRLLFYLIVLITFCIYPGDTRNGSIIDKELETKVFESIKERVKRSGNSFGIVVGIINKNGKKIINFGKYSKEREENVDGNTIFQLCSVTKVFTSLLAVDMDERGLININNPIEEYLPRSVKIPSKNGKKISFIHLSTHTSGLPSKPSNSLQNKGKPGYVGYTKKMFYEFLSKYELAREIGSKFEYSNIGVGLLGHILSLKGGEEYENLIKDRILIPLQMNDTQGIIKEINKKRLAPGHLLNGDKVKYWPLPSIFDGAGILSSTAKDMLKFLEANIGLKDVALRNAIHRTHKKYKKTGDSKTFIGLGWAITKLPDREIFTHSGAVDGYRSFIGFDKQYKTGVIVFSNGSSLIDDIGISILLNNPKYLKMGEVKAKKEIKLDPARLKSYTGIYQVTPRFQIKVTFENNNLFGQGTGQPKFQLYPESENVFFLKAVNAKAIFVKDKKGKIIKVIIRTSKGDEVGKKIK